MVELSEDQQDALDDIREWYECARNGATYARQQGVEAAAAARDAGAEEEDAQIAGRAAFAKVPQASNLFRLFGYAGTGKTTLAKEMQKFAGKVQYGALTGKAALVLRGKGCENARTIHSMIYRSMDKSTDERDALKEEWTAIKDDPEQKEAADALLGEIQQMTRDLQQPSFHRNEHAFDRYWDEDMHTFVAITPPDLICIDECSMVDKRVGQDLESFGIPILVLGDPAQLPPVASAGYFTNHEPDRLLTEIHRQAMDNPVLKLATQYRMRQSPALGDYGSSRIVQRTNLPAEEWLAADQILCGKNNTRHVINRRIRELRGFEGFMPMVGERLVCLRNNHNLGLLNGSMWEVLAIDDAPAGHQWVRVRVQSCDDPEMAPLYTLAHKQPFTDPDYKWEDMTARRAADEFDFGYAITTHKAQGSEWPNVIYVDEWPGDGADKARHRYTGVTRATERVTVVKW